MRPGGVISTIGTTEAAVFIPEIWGDSVLAAVEANLVMANLVDRQYEGSISKFGDTVRVPNVSNLSANPKVAGTSVTVQAPTETDLTILIDKHYETSFYVEDIAAIQANKPLREIYTKKAGYAIAKAIDDQLMALYAGLSQNDALAGNSAITEDGILKALLYLDNAEAPLNDRSIVIKPSQKKAMLKIDKFVRGDYTGGNATGASPMATGQIGEVFGCKVYVSSQIPITGGTVAHNLMFQKEAFALAVQMSPRVQAQYKQEYLATLVTVDVLFGVKEMRDTFGVDIQTTNV